MVQVRFTCLPGKQRGVHKWRPGSHWHPRPASDSVVARTCAHSFQPQPVHRRCCRHFMLPWLFLALYNRHAQCKIHFVSSMFFPGTYSFPHLFFFSIAARACHEGTVVWPRVCHVGQPLIPTSPPCSCKLAGMLVSGKPSST